MNDIRYLFTHPFIHSYVCVLNVYNFTLDSSKSEIVLYLLFFVTLILNEFCCNINQYQV